MERLSLCSGLDPNLLEYLTGFFDVSGSITIERNRDYRAKRKPLYSYPLRAELERVQTGTVDLFENIMSGYGANRPLPSGKIRNRWYVKTRKARLLLETLGPHFRLKAGHWEIVQEYIETSGYRSAEDSEKLKEEIRELNNSPKLSLAAPITDPYLAGVFDGHGSIDIYHQHTDLHLAARIAMKHKPFMEGIADYLETKLFPNYSHGIINAHVVALYSRTSVDFLTRMKPYSVKYRRLIPLALNFQDIWGQNKGRRRSDEQRAAIEAARELFIQERKQIIMGVHL